MYSPRLEKLWTTLEVLTYHTEVYQSKLPEKVGCSYRTIIRQLELLKNLGLARISRTQPEGKGKPHNVWETTFEGILTYLNSDKFDFQTTDFYLHEITPIAKAHVKKWIIFQEWKVFVQDLAVFDRVVNGLLRYCIQNVQRLFQRSKQEVDRIAQFSTGFNRPSMAHGFEVFHKTNAAKSALHLRFALEGAWPPWLDDEQSHNHEIINLWQLCMHNTNLRKFVQRQFNVEIERCQNIQKFIQLFKSFTS